MSEVLDETVDAPADNHPGVEDGYVDSYGERVVYEYDEVGELVGWHKEPAE